MSPTSMTVRDAAHLYLRTRKSRGELSKATERSYRARLDSFMVSVGPDRDVGRLQRRHVERWLDTLGGLAPTSRRGYWATARLFARWLRDQGHVDGDLFDGLKAPKEPRTVPRNLSVDDITAVLRACDRRERIVVILMLQLGLRRGEVARLTVEDVDVVNQVARIRGKGDHERMVPLPDQAARELSRWLGSQRITNGPVIRSRLDPTKGLRPETIGEMLVDLMYRAGVKQCGWDRVSGHSLRHSSAADMLRHGAHVRDVQQVLGHASLLTTQRYMPLAVATLESAVGGRDYS